MRQDPPAAASPSSDDAPLPFTPQAMIFGGAFLVVFLIWYALGGAFGVGVLECSFWVATISMVAAQAHYLIHAYGSKNFVDLLINLVQLGATMVLIAAQLGRALDQTTATTLAAAVTFAHPVLTDWPHTRRLLRSDVPKFVPPGNVILAWGTMLMVVVTLLMER